MAEKGISFDCEDIRIAGTVHVPDKLPAPGVVFCHGFTGTRIESHRLFVHAARKLCRQGFLALRFDFRGSGESGGLFQDMTVSTEIKDLKAAVTWMEEETDVVAKKIGVNGLSLGGAVTILTAAEDSRIAAVSVWSAPSVLSLQVNPAITDELRLGPVEELMRREHVDLPGGDRIGKAFIFDAGKHDISGAIQKISPRPVLIVHGTEDKTVPLFNGEKLYASAREPKEKFFVEGADHTFNRWEWQWAVINRTSDWFEEKLGP